MGTRAEPERREAGIRVSGDGASTKALRQGALAGLLGQAVVIGAGVVVQVLLARLLSPGEFGAYTLLTALMYFAAVVIRLGLQQLVVRATASVYLARGPDLAVAVARRVVTAGAVAATSALPLMALFVVPWGFGLMFGNGQLDGLSLAIAGIVAAEALRPVVSETFRGLHQQSRATMLGNALRMVLVVAPLLVVSAVRGQLGLAAVVWLFLGASVAVLTSATVNFVLVLRRTPGHPEERRPLRAIYLAGLPFLVTELTAAAMSMGDVVVLGRSVPHEELALYAAASRVAALISVPAFVATTVLTPAVASLWAVRRKDRLQVLLRGYGLLAAAPAAIALVVVCLVGHHLLGLLFGPYYRGGWAYLVVLATGAVLNTVLGFASSVLMTIGEVRIVVRVTVLAAIGTVAGEVVAVHLWGAMGVAAVAALGVFCQQSVLTLVCVRRTGLWALPGTSRHVAASLGGGT